MVEQWSRVVDPLLPYRAERLEGAAGWRAAAVACYSAAWQLALAALVIVLTLGAWTDWPSPAAWLFAPSIVVALAGSWCALSDRLSEDAFRWWGPGTFLVPAATGLAYAFGPRRCRPGGNGSASPGSLDRS